MRARLALLALALTAGCSSRAHLNPFDPHNPVTAGRPASFSALAGNGSVELRWAPAPAGVSVKFQVWRRVAGEADYKAISNELPASFSGFVDFGVLNGVRHDYRLYYVLSGAPSGLPAEDYATPGTRRVWFTDLDAQSFLHVTADGHHVTAQLRGFYGPSSVAYDAAFDRVWVSDTYDGRVVGVDDDDVARHEISGLSEPVALATDTLDLFHGGDLWICDQARNSVFHYTLQGVVKQPATLGTIDTPIGIAVDPTVGTVWVCERGSDRVRRFQRDGTPIGATAVLAPSRVAVDSLTHEAWVTSFDAARVVQLSPAGVPQDTIALGGPIGVAVDARRGRIWVADGAAGQVVAIRRGGAVEFRVPGLTSVHELAVDMASGECFATVPGEREFVRISPTGVVLERITNLANPFGVTLAP